MADAEFTTNPRVSNADFLHASERARTDGKSDGKEARDLVSVIEEARRRARSPDAGEFVTGMCAGCAGS